MLSFRVWMTLGLVLSACGCGSEPATGKVSGTITVNGTPLTKGVITIHSAGSGVTSVGSAPVFEGKYIVEKVATGPAKIAVQSLKPSQPGANPDGSKSPAPQGPFVPLAEKFNDPAQSGLTLDVKAGEQKHDIDIKTK